MTTCSLLPDILGDVSLSSMMRCMLVDWISVSAGVQEAAEEAGAGSCGTSAVSSWEVCGLRVGGGGQSRGSTNSCDLRGETGVGGSEDSLRDRMVAC